jgi:hypothetical protein
MRSEDKVCAILFFASHRALKKLQNGRYIHQARAENKTHRLNLFCVARISICAIGARKIFAILDILQLSASRLRSSFVLIA